MFKKILIANRGEIACRVIAHGEEDGHRHGRGVFRGRQAMRCHVELADEAVERSARRRAVSRTCRWTRSLAACKSDRCRKRCIPATASSVRERDLRASRRRGAGIVFIGPKHAAIAAMGDKIASKKLANEAKVSTIPGHNAAIDSAENRRSLIAQRHRLSGDDQGLAPAAAARACASRYNDKEAFDGFTSCRNEARSQFRRRPRLHREVRGSSRATSRSRCWAIRRATSCTCMGA